MMVARAGLFTEDSDIASDCLWAFSYMADNEDDSVIGMVASGENLPKIISYVGDKDF
jgi:hypothetical protein